MNIVTISDLKIDDQILFNWAGYHGDEDKNENVWNGHIVYIKGNMICVSILYGYKSTSEDVDFNDVLAVYDKNGEGVKIKSYVGPSRLTEHGKKWIEEHC